MEDLSITSLLSKYQHQQPKNFGDYMERQYPVSAVIDMIRELKNQNSAIQFAEWILKEGFEKYQDNGKCWWGRFNEEKDYSTEQLYEIWIGSLIK